jgi:hypothetical protein
MKRFVLAVVVLAMVFGTALPAMAKRPCWMLKADADTHYDPNFELGAGVDLILWEKDKEEGSKFLPDAIFTEGRWDFANENGGAYLVATFNLPERMKAK